MFRRNTLTALLISAVLITSFTTTAFASSGDYIEMAHFYGPVKVGSHYFKLIDEGESTDLARSKTKKGGFKKVLKGEHSKYYLDSFITNNKYIFAQKFSSKGKNSIVRYSASGKKAKTIKKLPKSTSYTYMTMAFVNGKYILLNKVNEKKHKSYIYRINRKTKKLKKIASGKRIETFSGNYLVAYDEWRRDDSYKFQESLYKLTSGGKLQKVRTLGSNVVWSSACFVDRKLYYCLDNGDSISLYRCDRDGKNTVFLTKIYRQYSSDVIYILNQTSTYCILDIPWNGSRSQYKFTYSTKALTPYDPYA